jgi:hypothetical protein
LEITGTVIITGVPGIHSGMSGNTKARHIIADLLGRRRVLARLHAQCVRTGRPAKLSLNNAYDWAVPSHRNGRQSGMTKRGATATQDRPSRARRRTWLQQLPLTRVTRARQSVRLRRHMRSIYQDQVTGSLRVMTNTLSRRSGLKGHVTKRDATKRSRAIVQVTVPTEASTAQHTLSCSRLLIGSPSVIR